MFSAIKNFFGKLAFWVKDVIQKHDANLIAMVNALIPLVAQTALRIDLSGDEKKKIVVDAVIAAAKAEGKEITLSLVNEAIEVAANRYKIESGKITEEQLESALQAVLNATK